MTHIKAEENQQDRKSMSVFYINPKTEEKLLPVDTVTKTVYGRGKVFKPKTRLSINCGLWEISYELDKYFMATEEYWEKSAGTAFHFSKEFYPPSVRAVDIEFQIQKRLIKFSLEKWEYVTERGKERERKVEVLEGVIEIIESITSTEYEYSTKSPRFPSGAQ